MLTPKQQKLIELIVENSGKKGKRKSLGTLIIEAGYSEETAKNPHQIINDEMMDELKPILTKFERVRSKALDSITDDKLEVASPRDNAYVADIMTKNMQLLTGGDTERINIPIQISEVIAKKNDINGSTK